VPYEKKHPPTPPVPPTPPSTPPAAKKSGCFIATAAYGSPLAPEVQFLRELRDGVLRKTDWGTRFFDRYWSYYYQMSPAIGDQMDREPAFKAIIRWSIVTPLINYLKLIVNRPTDWELDQVGPELREFLEGMKRGMEELLDEIELPGAFEGHTNDSILDELDIALGLILRGTPKADAYLDRLTDEGALPLRFGPDDEPGLLTRLVRAGRSHAEINRILYGSRGELPAVARVRGLGLSGPGRTRPGLSSLPADLAPDGSDAGGSE
jgi:hypothetical protein